MLKMNELCYSQQYFRHLLFIDFFIQILIMNNNKLFLKNILDINPFDISLSKLLIMNNNKLFLKNILDINPFDISLSKY